jgi:hypothetical protein
MATGAPASEFFAATQHPAGQPARLVAQARPLLVAMLQSGPANDREDHLAGKMPPSVLLCLGLHRHRTSDSAHTTAYLTAGPNEQQNMEQLNVYLLKQLNKGLLLLNEGLPLIWCKVDVIAAMSGEISRDSSACLSHQGISGSKVSAPCLLLLGDKPLPLQAWVGQASHSLGLGDLQVYECHWTACRAG